MSVRLHEIAELVRGRLHGDGSLRIETVGAVEDEAEGLLAALDSERLIQAARESKAKALLVAPRFAEELTDRDMVVVKHPQSALNLVIERLGLEAVPMARQQQGVHPTAVLEEGVVLGEGCSIGAHAVIGAGVTLGAGTRIAPHVVIEPGATLGARCLVQPQAVICSHVKIGDDCVIGSAAVIGAEGFGFDIGMSGSVRLHHIGWVILGNGVEIGNGTTIDRARFGATRIGDGSKLDSQVHIGHNSTIGKHSFVAAQAGFAGSSHVGNQCLIGGQAGLKGHIRLADGVQIAAKSGVGGNVDEAGEYLGFWAKPRKQAFREIASVAKLPAFLKEFRALKDEVELLRKKIDEGGNGQSSAADS